MWHSPLPLFRDLKTVLVNVAEQVKKDVNDCLVQHGFSQMDDPKAQSLFGQICDLATPDNTISKLMRKMLLPHCLCCCFLYLLAGWPGCCVSVFVPALVFCCCCFLYLLAGWPGCCVSVFVPALVCCCCCFLYLAGWPGCCVSVFVPALVFCCCCFLYLLAGWPGCCVSVFVPALVCCCCCFPSFVCL